MPVDGHYGPIKSDFLVSYACPMALLGHPSNGPDQELYRENTVGAEGVEPSGARSHGSCDRPERLTRWPTIGRLIGKAHVWWGASMAVVATALPPAVHGRRRVW